MHTLDSGPLLARQEALVCRIVAELAPFDNVYYEVQNEPYADLPQAVDVTNPYLGPAEVAKDWLFWKNRVERVDTKDGRLVKTGTWDHPGGRRAAESPPYVADVALRLRTETR